MIMEKAYKQKVFSILCSISGTLVLPIILLSLVLFSFLVFFSISKPFSFLLTLCITLLSAMFLVTMTKKKGSQEKILVHDMLQKQELQNSIDFTQSEVTQQSESTENSSFLIMDTKFEVNVQDQEQQSDSHSDSESFETDNNENENVSIYDNLASENDDDYYDDEEDSLIEIELQRSFFSDLTEEPKQKLESKLPDFLAGSVFKEQDLMEELLAEMNEDENLIEIDISMGCINSEDYRLKKEFATLGDQYAISE